MQVSKCAMQFSRALRFSSASTIHQGASHAFEFRHGVEKFRQLLRVAEAHHPLHARAVVPAAVEQGDLARTGQVADIALEIGKPPISSSSISSSTPSITLM